MSRPLQAISILGGIALLASIAIAQSGGGYDLSWNTIDGGGGTSTGGTYSLTGTIGQPDASPVAMTGADYKLKGGFLPGLPCTLNIQADFDSDCDVDQGDFALFESCASGPTIPHGIDCNTRDFDLDGDVDGEDFATFQLCITGEDITADPNCAN